MMSWAAIAIVVYSFYQVFSAEKGRELAPALSRLAISFVFLVVSHTDNETLIACSVLLSVTTVLVSLAILRKEVQISDNEL